MRRLSSLTRVDFPDPEGAEMMKTVVIRGANCGAGCPTTRLRAFFESAVSGDRPLKTDGLSHKIDSSFEIQRLLAHFFDRRLGAQSQLRNAEARIADPAGLGQNGVGLAI